MKKTVFSLIVILLYCPCVFAEYVVIDRIVYETHLKDLTATVLNYQTSISVPCDVTIPETIIYKNDTYKVTILGNPDRDTLTTYGSFSNNGIICRSAAYMSYYPYEYGKSRENIEHLHLPNTLKHIEVGAFQGMDRLRSLIIPSSVQTFSKLRIEFGSGDFLSGGGIMHSSGTIYYRLDSIIILGTPSCTTIEQKGDPWEAIFLGVYGSETTENIELSLQDSIGEYIYIQQMARIVAGVDAKTGMSKLCPNLKYFSIPKAEILLAKKVKVQELNKKCNASLNMLCDSLNEQLRKHPYYDHSVISFELHSSQYEDTYQTITNKYNQQETQLRQEFKDLVSGKMESNLKKNYTQQYLIAYQRQHPEHKHIIDSVYQEYRCYTDSVQSIFVVKVLEGYTINSKSCRQKQYQQYATLFDNKYDYDSIYNKVSSNKEFMQEIANREDAQELLDELQGILLENPKIKLHGIKTAKKGVPRIITEHLDSLQKTHFYDRAVKLILETNKPINAEYLKNGHYFANQQEFFEAYISPEYKKILKTNKMSK